MLITSFIKTAKSRGYISLVSHEKYRVSSCMKVQDTNVRVQPT